MKMNSRRRFAVLRRALYAVTLATLCLTANAGKAADFTWDLNGNPPMNLIDNGANWLGGFSPDLTSATVDNMIFSATNNPLVWFRGHTVSGDWTNTLTFDASAPSYTFDLEPGYSMINDLVVDLAIINNSPNTQIFNGGINLRSATMTAATADFLIDRTTGSGEAYVFNSQTASIFNGDHNIILRGFNALQTNNSSTNRFNIQMTGGGKVIVENDNTTLQAPISINTGALEIRSNGSLGTTTRALNILGGATNTGRLELTNNIAVTKTIVLTGRSGATGTASHISNLSGSNTLNATFTTSSGSTWNFESQGGMLTINGDLAINFGGERGVTFQGEGDGEMTGSISNTHASVRGLTYMKQGGGTWTLSGAANVNVANVIVHEGTLAFGASANSWTFGSTTDAGVAPRFYTAADSTLDVSAAGGYSLTQLMHGYGTVQGNVVASATSQILPGGQLTFQAGYGADIYVDANGFADTVGQLQFSNDLDLSSSGFMWQLGALSTSNPGVDFDQIGIGGNLHLGGSSTLTLDFSLLGGADPTSGNSFWNSSHSWKIIDTATNTGNADFVTLVNGSFAAGTFSTAIGSGADQGDVFLSFSPSSLLQPGDFDGDGIVDGDDFAIWQMNFPTQSGANASLGDGDGDGDVDGADFVVWQTNYPFPTPGPGTSPVPEPATWVLALVAAAGVCSFRSRRQK